MRLVLIETSGNQNYIFSTNKLKENIGASELTHQAGTKWILEAVASTGGSSSLCLWRDEDDLGAKLLDASLNPKIEDSANKVEIIVAASGKALLLTQTEEIAKQLIQFVTRKALIDASGLDICGVISDEFSWDENNALVNKISQVHQQFETLRSQRPSPQTRFLRLPIIAECKTSGLPASVWDVEAAQPDGEARSQVSKAKRELKIRESFQKRLAALLKRNHQDLLLSKSIDELESQLERLENSNWLAVIHADGNGLGEIFLNFENYIDQPGNNRVYVDKLRQFSIALDRCTEAAFAEALNLFSVTERRAVPLIPLIIGGDDLTVICEGRSALKFTQAFLRSFEQATADSAVLNGIIPDIAQRAFNVKRLSACAGIAIVKPHFPFSVAYDLSADLIQTAKRVKELVTLGADGKSYPCSALDFHVLYDSSSVSLEQIRKKLTVKSSSAETRLFRRPYVVTPEERLQAAQGLEWVQQHHWDLLERQVRVINAQEDGRRILPSSQLHDLRSGLFLEQVNPVQVCERADARYRLIRERYLDQGIGQLEASSYSLFCQVDEQGTEIHLTGLLDALEIAEFFQPNSEASNGEKDATETRF